MQSESDKYIYVYIYIYVIMKTMFPPSYHHNGFVATHALGHMMYIYIHIYIYITFTLLLWDLRTLCVMDHLYITTVVLDATIRFSVRFCDNSLLVLKMRCQVFCKQKGARVFLWQEDVNVVVISALSSAKPWVSFLKF